MREPIQLRRRARAMVPVLRYMFEHFQDCVGYIFSHGKVTRKFGAERGT
jgi:hypothetical protein